MELLSSVPLHRTNVAALTFSSDGTLLVSGSLGGKVVVSPVSRLAAGDGGHAKQLRRGMAPARCRWRSTRKAPSSSPSAGCGTPSSGISPDPARSRG